MSDEDDREKELAKRLKEAELSGAIKDLLANLSAREAKIIRTKFAIDPETIRSLEEVAKQFDITRQRIREIEKKALKKLRDRGPNNDGPDAA